MIRGIQKKYKQPIAYSFCQGATKQDELVHQLKEVIRNVHDTGLRVLATISDQGTANVAAINILKRDTRAYQLKNNIACTDEFYEVEVDNLHRLKLVHIFDVPHLIKCIRNNLVTKDLIFCTNGVQKRAKLSHILELYNEDCKIPDCKMLPRLSDNHVIPDKIFKMKVKCAAAALQHKSSPREFHLQ
uniref:Transposable element P transposase n=1 Tax=Schizaphis graminum TaxID=13262 RepID=A0A2S2NAR7_SCHGA